MTAGCVYVSRLRREWRVVGLTYRNTDREKVAGKDEYQWLEKHEEK